MLQFDGGKLIKMGFAVNEDLIFVSEDGKAYIYDLFGTFKKQFSLSMVSVVVFLIISNALCKFLDIKL